MQTKQVLWSLVLSLAVAQVVFAARIRERVGGPETAPTVMNLDAGIAVGGDTALPGVDLGINARIAPAPVYLGADLGLFFHTSDPSYAVIPFLGSLYFQFENYSTVHPLLGVLAGPVFATGGGLTDVRFGFLMRPGFCFELGGNATLDIEPRFGVFASEFVFIPQLGATIAM